MLELNKIYNLNCLEGLKLLSDNSIDMAITSPPYWGLRDYGTNHEIWDYEENCQHEWIDNIKNQTEAKEVSAQMLGQIKTIFPI